MTGAVFFLLSALGALAQPSARFTRLEEKRDAVPAIDTHDRLFPFGMRPGFVETRRSAAPSRRDP